MNIVGKICSEGNNKSEFPLSTMNNLSYETKNSNSEFYCEKQNNNNNNNMKNKQTKTVVKVTLA